jgi:hypothetical protein
VLEDVAVLDEPVGDAVLEERHHQPDLASPPVSGMRDIDAVHHLADVPCFVVAVDDEKVCLVDVENVVLAADVAHRPFLSFRGRIQLSTASTGRLSRTKFFFEEEVHGLDGKKLGEAKQMPAD